MMKKIVNLLWLLLMGGLLQGHSQTQDNIALKATYLLKFAKTMSWPQRILNIEEDFVIGILGDDKTIIEYKQQLDDQTAQNKPIVVRQITNLTEIRNYPIIYISHTNLFIGY
jgi:two-component system, chemotaxis family, sensor kinase Cph1